MMSRMVGSVLTLVILLLSAAGVAAQTYTQIQWGMNKGVTPYAFGANINGTWRDLGTVSAAGVWSIPSSNLSFIQSGAGAVTQTVDSKLKTILNVKDFGAVCDGVTNDTVAIQAAINSASSTRKELYFFGGTCLSNMLTLADNVHMISSSGVLKLAAGQNVLLRIPGNTDNVVIRGFVFDGANMSTVGLDNSIIYQPPGGSTGNLWIEDNSFINIPTNIGCCNATKLNGSKSHITHNYVAQSGGDTINTNGGFHIIEGNYVENSGDGCIALNNSARGNVVGNFVRKCVLGIGSGPQGSQSDTDIIQNLTIVGNTFESTKFGINLGWYAYAGRDGPFNWQISGNTFRNIQATGIQYDGPVAATDVNGSITGNTFYGTGAQSFDSTPETNAYDINIQGASGVAITGNSFKDPKGPLNAMTAIRVNGGSNFVISDNKIKDLTGGHYQYAIRKFGAGEKFIVAGNLVENIGACLEFDDSLGYSTVTGNSCIGVAGNGIVAFPQINHSTIANNTINGGAGGNSGIFLGSAGTNFTILGNALNWGGTAAINDPAGKTWTNYNIAGNSTTGATLPSSVVTNGTIFTGAATFNSGVTVGVAGSTVGSVAFKNATSGTITLQPTTGALGTVTATLPANTGTIAETNLAQTFSATQTFSSGVISAGTTPTATGAGGTCAAGTVTGGALVGTVALTGNCVSTDTLALTGMPAATTGYVCDATDRTAKAVTLVETTTTTTSATFEFTASSNSGNIIQFKCLGY